MPHTERSIFDALIDAPDPGERRALLDQACAGDAAMRRRVEALLLAHDLAGEFLEIPVLAADAIPGHRWGGDATPSPAAPGGSVGPYRLLEKIGEGGMGVVFMAEQERPVRRRVALKVIKPGLDSAQVVARFDAERQALAMMDHANIARVLDAGTTEAGHPYFVMELVEGVAITRFCDERRLTLAARLALFVSVCEAVQHAHQKGVIHRDLKPSNVLVTPCDGRPVPKVIDFGIAKAVQHERLTERTLFTAYGVPIGTPEYMSPEQAESSPSGVDTRSDVYSLGVLLYELLTGTTPLERRRVREAGFADVLRLIRDEEPPRPSTRLSACAAGSLAAVAVSRRADPRRLPRMVRGELDWIVMKCLERDRARRYATANALASDVQRYLHDEPVHARPTSAAYRALKFARRHVTGVAAAGAVALALLLGAGAATWGLIRAREGWADALDSRAAEAAQRRTAEESRRQAVEANDLLRDLLAYNNTNTPRFRAALGSADARLAAGWLADQPDTRASVHRSMSEAYVGLGSHDDAARHARAAVALYRQIRGSRHSDVANALVRLAAAAAARGDAAAAEAALSEAVEIGRALAPGEPYALHDALAGLIAVRRRAENDEGARPLEFELLRTWPVVAERLLAETRENATWLRYAAECAARSGQFDEAIAYHARLVAAEPENHWTWFRLALLRAYAGDVAGYRRDCREMLERFGDAEDPLVCERVVKACTILPGASGDVSRLTQIAERAAGRVWTDPEWAPWWRIARGMLDHRAGRHDAAAGHLAAVGPPAGDGAGKAQAELFLALAHQAAGRPGDARAALGRALHRIERLPKAGAEDLSPAFQDWLVCHAALAEARAAVGPVDVAAAWMEHLRGELAAQTAELESRPDDLRLRAVRADQLVRLGRFTEAAEELERLTSAGPAGDRAWGYGAAVVSLYLGDRPAHRRHVRALLARFADAPDFAAAETVAKACLVAPADGPEIQADHAAAAKLLDRALAARGAKYVPGFYRVTKGIAEYRAGDDRAAIRWLNEGGERWSALPGKVLTDSFLAMAFHRSGDLAAARVALARARQRAERELPPPGEGDLLMPGAVSWDWVVAQLALREAQELLEQRSI